MSPRSPKDSSNGSDEEKRKFINYGSTASSTAVEVTEGSSFDETSHRSRTNPQDSDEMKRTWCLPPLGNNCCSDCLVGLLRWIRHMSIFSVVVMGGIFVFLVVHVIWFLIAHGGVNLFNRHGYVHVSHPQVIPTLFSIQNVDDSSSGVPLVNALHNPLYDELRQASFHYDSRNSGHLKEGEEAVALTVDRQELHGGDPLTVSWKYGRNHRGRPVLQPQDVMALYCHNGADDADLTASLIQSTTQLLEIATIAEIQATHQQTILEQQLKNKDKTTSTHHVMRNSKGGKKDNQSIWFIPHFPVYRYSTCEFIVYQRKNVGPALSTPTTQLHYLASSGPIHLTSVTSPFGIHLSGTEHPTEMRVSFSTGSSGTPVASFGTENPPKTNRVTTGTSTTYGASDLCMEPANLTEPGKFSSPGILHTVVMTNLQPNTTYYYKVGLEHGQGVAWSQVFSYVSPLLPGDDSSFSYLVYGDQGCPLDGWSKGGAWTAALAKTQVPQVRAVHHFGDLSYARGAAHMWDAWLAMVEPYASKLPYHVAVGNHEYDYTAGGGDGKDPSGAGLENGFHPEWGNFGDDSGGECGVPTAKRFTMPNSPDSNGVFWYSHEFGSVHTTVLSSEHGLFIGSRQFEWLVADLASVNRTITPWLVVEVHRPLYESEKAWDQNAVGIAMRFDIENVLYDYKVDLVLSGHYHAFLRTCDGLFRNRCHNGGPLHITIGTAGAPLDNKELYETEWTTNYIRSSYGYGKVTVANSSSMLFEFISAGTEDDNATGTVLDHVWIKRNR